MLAYVHLRPRGTRFALVATAVDIVAISVLAVLSGGAFSHARLAFFLVPVAVAFRFRPSITAAAAVVPTTAAYVIQAVVHPARAARRRRPLHRHAGGVPRMGRCRMRAAFAAARTRGRSSRRAASPHDRSRLLADALEAEQRERQDARGGAPRPGDPEPSLGSPRARGGSRRDDHPPRPRACRRRPLVAAAGQLREAVFDLHPYVLEEAGLEAALRSIAQQAATRGRFGLPSTCTGRGPHPQEQLIFSAARELLIERRPPRRRHRVGRPPRRAGTASSCSWSRTTAGVSPTSGTPTRLATVTSASRRSACGSRPRAGGWTSCPRPVTVRASRYASRRPSPRAAEPTAEAHSPPRSCGRPIVSASVSSR